MSSIKTTGLDGRRIALLLVLMPAWVLTACSRPAQPPEISGELRVGTRNSPVSYYIDQNNEPAGFEHDLIEAFSQKQNWSLDWTEKDSPEALFDLLDSHRINMAAAALPLAVVKDRHLIVSPVLFETPVHVVYRIDDRKPRGIANLAGKKIALIKGSGHTPMLARLKRKHPGLTWSALEDVWPEELLVQLQAGEHDAVVINGMDFDSLRNHYPELAVAFDLPFTQKIVWALPRRSSQPCVTNWRALSNWRAKTAPSSVSTNAISATSKNSTTATSPASCSAVRNAWRTCAGIFRKHRR